MNWSDVEVKVKGHCHGEAKHGQKGTYENFQCHESKGHV